MSWRRRQLMLEPRIRIYWGKKEEDLMSYCDEGASKATARFLFSVITPGVLSELDERGYDTTTLRFQIRKKSPNALDRIVRELGA